MKKSEGFFGKFMSMTMPNEEVREFMEWLYILIFYISGPTALITLISKKGTPLITEMVKLGSFAVLYAILLIFLYSFKERVQRSVQQRETNKRYLTWVIFSLFATWFGIIILIGLLWLGLPLSEKCTMFVGGCLQEVQKIDWYVFLLPSFMALLAVIPPMRFLRTVECLYVEEFSKFLLDKKLKRVVIIADMEDEKALEFENCLKKRNIDAFVASDYRGAKVLKPDFIVILYRNRYDKAWLKSQWLLNQKSFPPEKKNFLPEENMLIFADSDKYQNDDFLKKSFEIFSNMEEMVLLRKSSPKESNLGE